MSGLLERRLQRLLPTLACFVQATGIVISLFNQATDDFAQSTELNPCTHTCSLGVEEQIYLLLPFVLWLSGFTKQSRHRAHNLFPIIGALSVASRTALISLAQTQQPGVYFQMPTSFWEMAAGCLVFIVLRKRARS